ncbi:hypothetical protein [Hoeflea sp.]|uniref:hypothetical protein n=1 Tax=Hoeflea sp. TaxID=1940281 RepID=UPI0019C20000|nr:hypothetical protein [Hoeflea sp.]MBC7282604.1 hypothetical protein [Hoeflea sp.]
MHITVKFNPGDYRAYTYAYDGQEQIEPGDFVIVETREGRKAVQVESVDVPKPDFQCKHISAVLIEKDI